MSAGAAAPVQDFLALIVAMGGDREKGFDPFPPDQYTCFADPDMQLSPRGRQALAWLQMKCLRPKRSGRTAFAADERKHPLRLKDLGLYFGWDPAAVTRIWKEIEAEDLAHKDADGKLWLHASVKPARKAKRQSEDGNAADDMRLWKIEDFQKYIRPQLEELPEVRRARLLLAYSLLEQKCRDMFAEAVAGIRELMEQLRAEILAAEGIILRRHAEDEEKANAAPPLVTVTARDLSVQNFFAEADRRLVQSTESTVYTVENESVQASYPYSDKEQSYKVSSEESEAPAGISCEDSPTRQDEDFATAETQEEGEGEASETAPAENLPVESGKSTAAAEEENNTVVAFIESYFQEPLSATLREQWAKFAHQSEVTPAAAVRFLMEKTQEKERKSYELEGPSALLKFARVDIKRWKARNRAFIARDLEREEARTRTTPEPEPQDPIDEFQSLQRTLETIPAGFPQQAEALRERMDELRPQLEADFAACLDLLAMDKGTESATGREYIRGRMERLKRILKTKADGAAG